MGARVLVDANVLFSRTLRDWLFLLRNETGGEVYTVASTEDVLAETIYRYRRRHPQAPGALIAAIHDRIVEQLDERVTDYVIDGSFPGGDRNDAHVHAAAVASGTDILVTADTGFTTLDDAVTTLPYLVRSADEFFVFLDDVVPEAVTVVTARQVDYWTRRGGNGDLAEHLRVADCPSFASRVSTRSVG